MEDACVAANWRKAVKPVRGSLLLLALAGVVAADPALGQTLVSGRVLDARTGEPIPQVQLTVAERERVIRGPLLTDAEGRFEVRLPPGSFELRLHRIGYAPRALTFDMVGEEPLELELFLEPEAIVLDSLEVTAPGMERGRDQFERRRSLYEGAFLDPIHVALMEAPHVIDILRQADGLIMDGGGIRSIRSPCLVFFLDHYPWPMGGVGSMHQFVAARDVRAVEVYRHIREVPDEIRDGYRWPRIGNECGIVQVWTSMGW